MMWSRTSTANKAAPLRVCNELAEYAALGVKNIRKPRRQIVKRHRGRQQSIQTRIGQQRDRGGQSAAMRPTRPPRGRHLTDLARNQTQPAAMECAAERNRHLPLAVPAQF